MEKAMYPSKIIRITQKHGVGTHARNFAVDEAGIDGGISNLIAPFTGVIKKIYTSDANEVWLESVEPVEYTDGTKDYMTIMFAHDNDVSNLKVGQVIKQGQVFYQEGTKGQATGNHVHFECGKGKFTGTGWHNDNGSWDINNGKRVDECLWIDDTYTIKDAAGYNFKKVITHYGTPVIRNEDVEQIQIKDGMTSVRARKTPNGEVLGLMNIGLYNILEKADVNGYTWCRVENNLWFAHSDEWSIIYSKKEIPVEPPKPIEPEVEEPTIEELQNVIDSLEDVIKDQDAEILKLKKQLEEQPKEIFTCTETADYQIKLYENEKLFIK